MDWNIGPPYSTVEVVATAVVFLACMVVWRLYSGQLNERLPRLLSTKHRPKQGFGMGTQAHTTQ